VILPKQPRQLLEKGSLWRSLAGQRTVSTGKARKSWNPKSFLLADLAPPQQQAVE
jgi:hypothetical protein